MKKRILIVDDEFGLADVVAEILAERGFEVAIALNGALGLQSAREQMPDLVVADLMMPVMDGVGMARALRAEPALAHIPLILMTALPEAIPQGARALWQAILTKPFTPDTLLSAVAQLLTAN